MSLIKEAGLNTLLGMGMTFLVLISLSLIIALFGKILNGGFEKKPAAQAKGPQKPAAPAPEAQTKAAPPVEEAQEAAPAAAGENPDLIAVISAAVAAYEDVGVSPETVAVIAAAVTAYEGGMTIAEKAGVSGFAVRRVRKSRKRIA
ncbi:MAG: OadG family protein [Eubacteriales bacterium]|nr:OadG family protein [Eubacteriales bacterium]